VRRWLRWLAGLASTLLLSLLALLFAAGFLLHSEQGTRWLAGLAQDFVPGELRIGGLQGRLTGPLELADILYRDGDLSLSLARLYLDWRPGQLLGGRLHVLALELEQGDLRLPPAAPDDTPGEPFAGLELPLAVSIDAARVLAFRVTPHGQEPVQLEQLSLAGGLAGDTLSLERLQAEALGAGVEASGQLRLTPELPLDLTLAWRYRPPELPELAGDGRIVGDLRELRVQQSLAAPLSSVLDARLFEVQQALRWQAALTLSDSDLGAFAPDFPARLSGTLQASGNLDSARLESTLGLDEPTLGRVDLVLAAAFRDRLFDAERLLLTTPAGTRLQGAGRYALSDAQGVFDAELSWSALRWPLSGDAPQVNSEQGSLKIDGRPDDFAYRLALGLQLPQQPSLSIEAGGRGSTRGLDFKTLAVVLPKGRIDGSGSAAWAPQPAWDLKLNGTGIDPSLFHDAFPGDLGLALNSRGQVEQDGPHARVQLLRLDGTLRDYPLAAAGDLQLAGPNLTVETLTLNSGDSRLEVQGRVGDSMDLDWSLNAADLASLWPGLGGSLRGKGRLAGSPEAPSVRAELAGSSLAFEEHGAQSLALRADLDLAGGQKLDLDLSARDIKSGAQRWEGLSLKAKGERKAHRIDLDLAGKDAPSALLAIDAGLDQRNTWSGRLQSLTLTLPDVGRWVLEQPAPFRLSADVQRVQALCLAAEVARLCADADAAADKGWKAKLNAPAFPLAFFQPWLPPDLKLTGRSDLAANFSGDAAGHVQGQADLALPEGRLGFTLRGEPRTVDFTGGSAQASLDAKGARAKLVLPLAGLGGIRAEVGLPGLQPASLDLQKQPLNGRIEARIDDLGLAEVVAPQLQNVGGYIDADLRLAGTLAKPRVQGAAELKEGAVDIPELGMELRELGLAVRAPALDRLTLAGRVKSGSGELTLEGETELDPERGFPTQLKVKGEDWTAVDIPEATVKVSPNLVILHNKERTELDGEVRIPFGRIRPRELPSSAMSSSADLVVVGGDSEPQEHADPRFHSKLRIVFGDQVSFDGFGLRANLNGDLLIIDEPGRPVIGRGRVGIVDGSYRAYGQDLSIHRGYAMFADSPVDNPGLDVQAQREAGDVTAGLRVSGTLKTPKLTLFSTPAMTQSEIASYLLTGRPPGESSGGSVGVSAALQAAGAESLTSEVSRQLGLDELRVETGSSLAEASVVAGTYLSPRLYVQYVNELASRETKLRFRYDLNKRLQIQTETGRSQGVDLFYTIEH
jgi:translocation and assembly module TamB